MPGMPSGHGDMKMGGHGQAGGHDMTKMGDKAFSGKIGPWKGDARIMDMKAHLEASGMKVQGGCYCGAVRYRATGEALMRAQCHCRECQYITGGGPNMFLAMPIAGFKYTKGTPKQFARADLANARAEVLVDHCLRSNAGLFYADRDEFVECLKLLAADDRLRAQRHGRERKQERDRSRATAHHPTPRPAAAARLLNRRNDLRA